MIKRKIKAVKMRILRIYDNTLNSLIGKKIPYLKETGWLESRQKMRSFDKNNNPIPWYTYPFLDFIDPRLGKKMKIFEYGCGNSTLWWAKSAEEVISCEHNKIWVQEMGNCQKMSKYLKRS